MWSLSTVARVRLVPANPEDVDTDGLLLRRFVPDDTAALLSAFADDDIARWNPGPASAGDVATWIDTRNDWTSGRHASWAVRDQDDRLLGAVSLHRIDDDQLDAEVGYWVAPWARRQQVGVRALTAATRYAFRRLGLHRVYLFHAVDNAASCRLASRAGFRHEGVLQQSYRYADGRYHDEHLHAMLATELPQ